MRDYYGEHGCCLTCKFPDEMDGQRWGSSGCLCFECKCRNCEWYGSYQQGCTYQPGDVIVLSERACASAGTKSRRVEGG